MIFKHLFTSVFCLISLVSGQSQENDRLQQSARKVSTLITADLLSRSEFMVYQTPGVTALHYAEVCAAYGAIKIAGQTHDVKKLNDLIARYYSDTTRSIPNTKNHVDANVFGMLPLEIFIQTREKKFLDEGLSLAKGQWASPLPNGMSSQTRYWIDDVYMIGGLQVQAYRATNEMSYLERAAVEIDSYIEKLQQPNGLFHHGADAPFYWGRGNGWVAAGLAELLTVLPKSSPHHQSILNGYKKMMQTLLDHQSQDGMWHQVIDHPESFRETSSTAMFGFAMALGVKMGLLPGDPYTGAYIKAWDALVKYINDDGKIREVCVGTGQSQDINFYFNRPRTIGDLHGQAPMLWFASVLIGLP